VNPVGVPGLSREDFGAEKIHSLISNIFRKVNTGGQLWERACSRGPIYSRADPLFKAKRFLVVPFRTRLWYRPWVLGMEEFLFSLHQALYETLPSAHAHIIQPEVVMKLMELSITSSK
jgi:hypothetical protein